MANRIHVCEESKCVHQSVAATAVSAVRSEQRKEHQNRQNCINPELSRYRVDEKGPNVDGVSEIVNVWTRECFVIYYSRRFVVVVVQDRH